MGNSEGNLADYWDVIYATKYMQGGFIWDWVDQTIIKKRNDGTKWFAYGGDLGYVGVKNDSNFCANGLVTSDRLFHPHAYEVQKVYQNINFKAIDASKGKFEVINRHDFIDLSRYRIYYTITSEGKVVKTENLDLSSLVPQSYQPFILDFSDLPGKEGAEYFINFYTQLKDSQPLLPADFIVARDQFLIKKVAMPDKAKTVNIPEYQVGKDEIVVSGNGFTMNFDAKNGILNSYTYKGTELMKKGPLPNFWRAPTDNDLGNSMPTLCAIWREQSLKPDKIKVEVKTDSLGLAISVNQQFNDIAVVTSIYHIGGNGSIRIENTFKPLKKDLPELPRLGMQFTLPAGFDSIAWYGRGPHENYSDRHVSAFVGLYKGSVWEQFHPYVRPQETGNKTGVRWMTLTNSSGIGWLVAGNPVTDASAWAFEPDAIAYVPSAIKQKHGADVKKSDLITVNVDYGQRGLGGDNSWGALPHKQYRIFPADISWTFILKPVSLSADNPFEVYTNLTQ
jgi:beta-galactosidase